MNRIYHSWALLVYLLFGCVCLTPVVAVAQESQHSVSSSSDYAPPINPPNLDDLAVFIEHLEKLDIEIATMDTATVNAPQPDPSPASVAAMQVPAAPIAAQPNPIVVPVIAKPSSATESLSSTQSSSVPSVPALPEIQMVEAPPTPVVVADTSSESADPLRLVLNIKGSSKKVKSRQIPDETGMTTGYLDARCYQLDVFDAQSEAKVGKAEQCFSEISSGSATPSLSGIQMIETTILKLDEGRLVVQELSTLQPLNWSTGDGDDDEYTHLTGARTLGNARVQSADKPFTSTGSFKQRRVKLRSSGMIDLSREHDGEIAIDSVFVLDLS
ncbi:MAG: hypothetical protein KTR32_24165 [Granulosicoccus sp.]|nr:hypothetical protein [Granulosicoccus sp.]